MRRREFLLLILSAGLCRAGIFSEGRTGPPLLEGGASVRARALGGAYAALGDDPAGVDWNPAGIQFIDRPEVAWSHSRGVLGRTEQSMAAVGPFWAGGGRRTWGADLRWATEDSVPLMEEGVLQGTARPREWAIGATLGGRAGGVNWGARLQQINQRVTDASHRGLSGGVGVLAEVRKWRGGVALSNLGPRLSAGGPHPPTALRAGAARRFGRASRWTTEVDWTGAARPFGAVGIDVGLPLGKTTFYLRGGYRAPRSLPVASRFSLGAGWVRDRLVLDYGFFPSDELGTQHRLSFGWRWGAALPAERAWRSALDRARTEMADGRWLAARESLTEASRWSPGDGETQRLNRELDRHLEESLDPDTLFHIGQDRAAHGDDAEAAVFLRRWALLRPEADLSLLRDVESRLESARTARLRERMKQDAETERRRLKALTERRRADGDLAGALEAAGAWAALDDPEGRRAWDALRPEARARAEAAASAGNWPEALRWTRLETARHPSTAEASRLQKLEAQAAETRVQEGRRLYDDGVRAYREGRRDEARTLFDQALALWPDSVELRRARERLQRELDGAVP